MNVARLRRIAALVLFMLPLLTSLSGCKLEHLESTGSDDDFLRLPTDKPAAVPMGDGPILPATPGTRWIYATKTEIQTQNNAPAPEPKIGQEEVVALGPKTVGKASGTAFKIYQDGKAFREEVLRLDDQGLAMVAAGITNGPTVDTMTITPGIVLVESPLREGAVTSWEGVLRLTKNNVQAPGYAYSRVSAREVMDLPLGKNGASEKIGAYKVETLISTTVEGRSIYLYSARWFSPGIGMVRQRVINGNQVITKTLKSVKRPGAAKVVAQR